MFRIFHESRHQVDESQEIPPLNTMLACLLQLPVVSGVQCPHTSCRRHDDRTVVVCGFHQDGVCQCSGNRVELGEIRSQSPKVMALVEVQLVASGRLVRRILRVVVQALGYMLSSNSNWVKVRRTRPITKCGSAVKNDSPKDLESVHRYHVRMVGHETKRCLDIIVNQENFYCWVRDSEVPNPSTEPFKCSGKMELGF